MYIFVALVKSHFGDLILVLGPEPSKTSLVLQNKNKNKFLFRGSCIPVQAVYIKGQLEKVIPSFYDDLICLPVIVTKIEAIQKTLVNVHRNIFITIFSDKKRNRFFWGSLNLSGFRGGLQMLQ